MSFRETRGAMPVCELLPGGAIHISGWGAPPPVGAPPPPPRIVDAEVRLGDVRVEDHVLEKARAASPDVAAAHPGLVDAGHARFYLTIAPGAGGRPQASNCLATVTPIFSDGTRGVPLAALLTPTLPLPDPGRLQTVGDGMDSAFEFLGHLLARAGLTPHSHVLDVGCGIGRMAYPLAYYLDGNGGYDGFDIMPDAIAWAREAIGARRPGFRFQHVDLFNQRYNPRGTLASDRFRFPFPDHRFDVVFLTSVFTHMLEAEVLHYLDEFARVSRVGGRTLISCFLLTEESERWIRDGRSTQDLRHPLGIAKVVNPAIPEESIGFPESWLRARSEERGFRVLAVHPGSWCGREKWISYQDLVVLERR